MFHRRRKRFRFTEKEHSQKGIMSIGFSLICLLLLILFLLLAYYGEGNLSPYYGSAGVFTTLLSLGSFALAIHSTRDEDSFALFPRISLVVSFIVCACWIGIYVIGFTL